MIKLVSSFLFFIFISTCAYGLVPLEGLILGQVDIKKQFDPYQNALSYSQSQVNEDQKELEKIEKYKALFWQGSQIKNRCDIYQKSEYKTQWEENQAVRSIIAQLQYLGLDRSVKAIAAYARKLEFSDNKYHKFVQRLMQDTCSENISVYSLNLLRKNFEFQWKNSSNDFLPSVSNNPFFSENFKRRHNTSEVINKEFNYTLRNFRAFCSWNGDIDDFRMLVPYLKNPFIMSYVFNQLSHKELVFNEDLQKLILQKGQTHRVQVACEDMICRRRNKEDFERIFPRMVGSYKFEDDLERLYCEKFYSARYKQKKTNPKVQKWIEEQAYAESKIEAMQFFALLTKVPDPMIASDQFSGLVQTFEHSIKARWDLWAQKSLESFDKDQLYEEPLELTLVENSNVEQIKSGVFQVEFNIGLSEVDKVLEDIDKIDASFYLSFPWNYFASIKKRIHLLSNRVQKNEIKKIEERFYDKITHQLKNRQRLLHLPIWNRQFAQIIGDEILRQINIYSGEKMNLLSQQKLKIPVKLKFGVFALRYIRQKNKFEQKTQKTLTFK